MMKNDEVLQQIDEWSTHGQMIAVGNDLVHLPTFNLSFTPEFIKRGYTENEIAYCEQFADSRLRYASTWAAKEAVYKAIKQVDGNIKLWWQGIEITRSKPQGKPTVTIRNLKTAIEISLTISHDGDYVWALAICMKSKEFFDLE